MYVPAPHSGQTHCARAIPAKTAAAKCLKFAKSFTLKPKVKKFTEKFSFVRRVCIANLIIIIHLLYRLVFWFTTAFLVTFPYKLLAHYASNSWKSQGSENRKWR